MKNTIKYIAISAIAIIGTVSLNSCKKDKKVNPVVVEEKGSFTIEFEHVWNGAAFELNKDFKHSALNDMFNFTKLRYYISNIKLKKSDGTWWAPSESYYLIDISKTEGNMVKINNVPKGDYTDISYLIGVDSARNVSGAQTGVLSTSEDMFWSWSSGYIFMKFEGSSPQSGTGKFTYHIGGFSGSNNALNQNTHNFMGGILGIKSTAAPVLHLGVNVETIWNSNVKVASINNVTMPSANAVKIATNFASAFEFEHIHN